jgi:hypothetical protein
MSRAGAGQAVEIEISVAATQPPQGDVAVEGGHRQCFVGWLQLLRILVEAVAEPTSPSPPKASRPRGETS